MPLIIWISYSSVGRALDPCNEVVRFKSSFSQLIWTKWQALKWILPFNPIWLLWPWFMFFKWRGGLRILEKKKIYPWNFYTSQTKKAKTIPIHFLYLLYCAFSIHNCTSSIRHTKKNDASRHFFFRVWQYVSILYDVYFQWFKFNN